MEEGEGNHDDFVQLTFKGHWPNLPVFYKYKIGDLCKAEGMNPDVAKDVCVSIFGHDVLSKGKLKWIKGRVRVICEAGGFEPDPEGTWGVCPMSWRTP